MLLKYVSLREKVHIPYIFKYGQNTCSEEKFQHVNSSDIGVGNLIFILFSK